MADPPGAQLIDGTAFSQKNLPMEILAASQNNASVAVLVIGVVILVLGVLWPGIVWSFAKFAQTPQTGGWGPISSDFYKQQAEENTKRVRREASAMQRSVKYVCPG